MGLVVFLGGFLVYLQESTAHKLFRPAPRVLKSREINRIFFWHYWYIEVLSLKMHSVRVTPGNLGLAILVARYGQVGCLLRTLSTNYQSPMWPNIPNRL